jgi:hypothetical protein
MVFIPPLMITTLKDLDGKVVCYCEWRLVGPSGYDCENGEYVWINDMWIHETFRNKYKVNRIIDEVMRICPQANYCYFHRKNKNDKIRIYTRSQWERRRHAYDSQLIKEN